MATLLNNIFELPMKRFFKQIHLWLSIPAGIIITIICLTGAILVFEDELNPLFTPKLSYVESNNVTPLPMNVLLTKANAQLRGDSLSSIQMFKDKDRAWLGSIAGKRKTTAYINPYSGDVLGVQEYSHTFFGQIMKLHRWLMDDSRTVGKAIVGISTIFMVFILISGLAIWLPKKWKNRANYTIKTDANTKRLFYDLHRILGLYAVLFLLLMALTGLMWSYDWYRDGVYRMLGEANSINAEGRGHHHGSPSKHTSSPEGEKREMEGRRANGHRHAERSSKSESPKGGEAKEKAETPNEVDAIQWQQAIASIERQHISYQYVRFEKGQANILPENATHKRALDVYTIAPNGDASLKETFAQQKGGRKIMIWAYILHTGAWMGIFSKILTFLAALIGGSLPITGFYLYIMRLKRKKRSKSIAALD